MEAIKMYQVISASSLNLRTGRRKENRLLEEPIQYNCSFCEKRKRLGHYNYVLIKVIYSLNGKKIEVKICDSCVDVFCDLVRWGPKVMDQIHRWKRKSKVVRFAVSQDESFCFRCMKTAPDSHVYLKFDDLKIKGDKEHYASHRVCAQCSISYFEMMKGVELSKYKLTQVSIEYGVLDS